MNGFIHVGQPRVVCARRKCARSNARSKLRPTPRPFPIPMKGTRNSLSSLRIFLTAAETLNFSRAAEALNLTQSAVSSRR